ncbi:unnamed protein product, partial [Prorocentrum cordatum]
DSDRTADPQGLIRLGSALPAIGPLGRLGPAAPAAEDCASARIELSVPRVGEVGITRLRFSSSASMCLKPLVSKIPIVGAVQFFPRGRAGRRLGVVLQEGFGRA